MLKLKPQYFGHLIWRANSLEKSLMLGKIEGRRRREWQRMRWLDSITDSMDMSLSKLREWWGTGRPGVLQSMGSQRVGHTEWLSWTELKMWGPSKSFLTFPAYLGIEKKFQVAPARVRQFRISMEAETGLRITNSLVWKHKVFCCCCLILHCGHAACRILVIWPGIKPIPPAVSLNHWTTREDPWKHKVFDNPSN